MQLRLLLLLLQLEAVGALGIRFLVSARIDQWPAGGVPSEEVRGIVWRIGGRTGLLAVSGITNKR